MTLISKVCVACEEGAEPLNSAQIQSYLGELTAAWELVDDKEIRRLFQFDDFKSSMRFVDKVAALAEAENHHPDIHIEYNRVTLELSTHTVNGLSENDFILAAKIEQL